MDRATEMYIKQSMNVTWKGKKCTVMLPRVCNWYGADFGTAVDAVMTLEKYFKLLPDGVDHLSQATDIKVKFQPYSFKCRQLSVLKHKEEVA